MRKNEAERLLDAPAGTIPLVAEGPEGRAFRVRSVQRILVLKRRVERIARSAKDKEMGAETVASKEQWTDSLRLARHLVDPENHKPPPPCKCPKCRKPIRKK